MPIYEYECTACRLRFERRQRFDEEPVASCPECSGKARRVIHSVPVLFRGSGFYCTDYGRGSSGNPRRKDDVPAKAKDTETKPEAAAKATNKDGD